MASILEPTVRKGHGRPHHADETGRTPMVGVRHAGIVHSGVEHFMGVVRDTATLPASNRGGATQGALPRVSKPDLLLGRAKRHTHAEPHDAMRSAVRGTDYHLVGITETSCRNAPDASGRSPMDPTNMGGKPLTKPAAAFGMRSRQREVGPEEVGAAHRRNVGKLDCANGEAVMAEAIAGKKVKRHLHQRGDCDA